MEVRRVAPDLVKVSLDPGPALRAEWLAVPGGYVTFNLPLTPAIQRCYSLVSAPDDPFPRIAVKELPGGRGSAFFNRTLKAGMVLEVMPPRTRIHEPWMDDEARHWMLFGAGIGVTPLLGLARHALASNPDNRVSIFLVNKSVKRIPLYNSCEAIASHPRAEVHHILTDGSQDDPLYTGRLNASKTSQLIHAAQQLVAQLKPLGFASGPAGMMEAVREGWMAAGLPWHHLRSERFNFPPVIANAGDVARPVANITFSRGPQQWSFQMPAGRETLLDAAMKAGVPVNHRCRGGVCGTCRATLISGEVQTDKPLGGDQILCCQSRPASSDLTVQLG